MWCSAGFVELGRTCEVPAVQAACAMLSHPRDQRIMNTTDTWRAWAHQVEERADVIATPPAVHDSYSPAQPHTVSYVLAALPS